MHVKTTTMLSIAMKIAFLVGYFSNRPQEPEVQKRLDELDAMTRPLANNSPKGSFTEILLPYGITDASKALLSSMFVRIIDKFVAAEVKHNWQDEWRTASKEVIQKRFHEHVQKGDPADVAIFAIIMMYHGYSTKKEK